MKLFLAVLIAGTLSGFVTSMVHLTSSQGIIIAILIGAPIGWIAGGIK